METTRRLPLLERSSQLRDSFEDFESPKRVVHYNPLKDARRKKQPVRRAKKVPSGSSSGSEEVRPG